MFHWIHENIVRKCFLYFYTVKRESKILVANALHLHKFLNSCFCARRMLRNFSWIWYPKWNTVSITLLNSVEHFFLKLDIPSLQCCRKHVPISWKMTDWLISLIIEQRQYRIREFHFKCLTWTWNICSLIFPKFFQGCTFQAQSKGRLNVLFKFGLCRIFAGRFLRIHFHCF